MDVREPAALILICLLLMPHALATDIDQSLKDLKDNDDKVRYNAVHSLWQMAKDEQNKDPRVFDPLIQALDDKDSEVRSYAAQAIGYFEDPRAIDSLVLALNDTDKGVRSNAAWAIGWVACAKQPESSAAVDPLIKALNDEYNVTRSQAAIALGCLNDPKAIGALTESLQDEDSEVRSQAAGALERLGVHSKSEEDGIRKSFFKIAEWGFVWTLDHLGENYFAAYGEGHLSDISIDADLRKNNLLSRILFKDFGEKTITSTKPLEFKEGYKLELESVDKEGNKAYIELYKNDSKVDSAIIYPSIATSRKEIIGDGNYTYSIKIGDSKRVMIYVHFKNAFRGDTKNIATVDRIRQLSESQPSNIIFESIEKRVIATGDPLRLEEGYELAIKSVDVNGNKIYLELSKNGQVLDSRVVTLPNDGPESYTYQLKKNGTTGLKIISIHFRSAFRGKDQNLSVVDGMRQVSENQSSNVILEDNQKRVISVGSPLQLKEDYELGINSIDINGNKVYVQLSKNGQVVDSAVIVPANDEPETYNYSMNAIDLESSKMISVHFKNSLSGVNQNLATVDGINQKSESQPSNSILEDNRRKVISSGSSLKLKEGYELGINSIDIKGNKVYVELYRDGRVIDKDIIKPTNDGPETYVYPANGEGSSNAESISIHFKNSFGGKEKNIVTIDRILQAAESQPDDVIYKSIEKIVFDNLTPLKLKEGYEISIKSIDVLGDKVYVELSKDGQVVDSAIIKPPEASNDDKTYTYAKDLGDAKGMVIIAVHFKNSFGGSNTDIATVDGIWQISENPVNARNMETPKQAAFTSL